MCISNEFVCFKRSHNKKAFVLHTECLNAPVACVVCVGLGILQEKVPMVQME